MTSPRLLMGLAIAGALVVCSQAPGRAAHASATSDAPGAAEHAAGDEPIEIVDPLVFDPDLAIFSLVIFLVLLVVLKKFAWGPIIAALEGREHGIAAHIAEAQRSHDEAKQLLAQYEQKLAQAAHEVRDILEEARRDSERVKQGILAEAKAGAEAERARALHEIEAATDQALKSLAERSAQLAVDLAGKILQSKLSATDHQRLIQDAMTKFSSSTPSAN